MVRRAVSAPRRREWAVSLALLVAGVAVLAVSVSVGDFPVPLPDVVPAVLGTGGAERAEFVVRTLRLPRAVTAMLVGAAFASGGSVFQTLVRNPLASPDVIGISGGASAAAVAVIVLTDAPATVVAASALAGATLTAVAIYLLAYRRGVTAYRFILVGIALAAMLSAVTSFLLTRAQIYDAQQATVWLTGSLNGRSWNDVATVGVPLVVLAPALAALTPSLRLLQLGDDAARGLGVPVQRHRAALMAVAVGLIAFATAAAGPVAFVAFVSGPIARRVARSPLALVPSALVGALVLLVADLGARRLFAPTELPVGVVTGLVGAPYLMWLLARWNRVGRGG